MSRWLPVLIVVALVAALVAALAMPRDEVIKSQWVGKPIPAMAMAPGAEGLQGIDAGRFRDGQPRLVNIFASWCIPCRVEAPILEMLASRGVTIDGVALRDKPENVAEFLAEYGNPFARVGADPASKFAIAIGSSGVPETFVVDGAGIVRAQYQGALNEGQAEEILRQFESME